MKINQNNQTNTSNTEAQYPALVKNEVKPDLSLEGELNLNDYVKDVPVSPETIDRLVNWASQNREKTRTNIAMWQVRMFSCSIALTFLIVGVAAFHPNADKTFIKDIIPLVLTPQVTILAGAVGYYFGATKDN